MEENGSEIEEGAADDEAADDESIDEDEAILNERRGASRPRNNI
jgi:hypothetical protein